MRLGSRRARQHHNEQSLITAESDKHPMDSPSHAGVEEVLVGLGDKYSKGSVVAIIASGGIARPAAELFRRNSPGAATFAGLAGRTEPASLRPRPRRCR